jgi:alkylmercury lyase
MGPNPASANLSDRLVASVAQTGSARTTPGLYRELLRLLSRGEPVTIAGLAAAAGYPTDEAQRAVAGWNDTEYDAQGRIIGWGLTLRPTRHKFAIDGKQLYTWCAVDTLFMPAVIGRPARVESPCAATGIPVRLTVDPSEGVSALDPATAVVSLVTPEQMSSVRTAFCNPSRYFATPDAARGWQSKHPRMELLSVADAYCASRPLSEMLLDENTPPP